MRFALASLRRFGQFLSARPSRIPHPRARVRPVRLHLEGLEARVVPATPGSLDAAFGNAGVKLVSAAFGASFRAEAATVQSDGKIVLAGGAFVGGVQKTVVARLSADGTQLDPSFGTDGFFSPTPGLGFDLANDATGVQVDGQSVVVAGTLNNGYDTDYFALRLTSTGQLDSDFGPRRLGFGTIDGGNLDLSGKLFIDPSGNYLVAGGSGAPDADSLASNLALARFTPDGRPDPTFGNTGVPGLFRASPPGIAHAVAADASGDYLLAGSSDNNGLVNPVVARVRADGSGLTPGFGSEGISTLPEADFSAAYDIAPAAGLGSFAVVGAVGNTAFVSVVDPSSGSFAITAPLAVPGATTAAYAVTVDGQGRIVVAGTASAPNASDVLVARYNPNLLPDTSFGQPGTGIVVQDLGYADDAATAVAVPTAGTILVAGHAGGAMMAARFDAAPGPIARDDTVSVNENATDVVIPVLANDSGTGLMVWDVTPPNHGTLTVRANQPVYTPTPGYYGPDTFAYTIYDDQGLNAGAIVNITVVNHPPVAGALSYEFKQDSSDNAILAADLLSKDSDPEGDPLFIVTTPRPAHGTLRQNGDTYLYTPAPGYAGSDSFTYTIADGQGNTATGTVLLYVDPRPVKPPQTALSLFFPGVVHVHHGLASFRGSHLALRDVNPRATITLHVSATHGLLHFGPVKGVKLRGHAHSFTLSGSLAVVTRDLGTGVLNISDGRPVGMAEISIFASDGKHTSQASISVQ